MNTVFKIFINALLIAILIPSLSFSQQNARRKKGARIGKKVSFQAKDGVIIQGLYMPATIPGRKTFILLHGLGSNQEEWQSFIQRLMKYGFGFLSYDARGHGTSITTVNNEPIRYENFGPPKSNSNWEKMVLDLGDAVLYLTAEKNIPLKKIGLVGASMGANVCLLYAEINHDINMVVLLSPGLNYAGLGTEKAIQSFKNDDTKSRFIALVASPNDTYAYQSACFLHKQTKANKRALFLQGSNSNHGVQMLDKTLATRLLNWMAK